MKRLAFAVAALMFLTATGIAQPPLGPAQEACANILVAAPGEDPEPATIPASPLIVDADEDGVPIVIAQQQTVLLARDCTITFGDPEPVPGQDETFPDTDDGNPDEPGVNAACPVEPFYAPTVPRIEDADGDGVPVLIGQRQEMTFDEDCIPSEDGEVVDDAVVRVAFDADDSDASVPLGGPCSDLLTGELFVPTPPRTEDKDGDGVPLIILQEAQVIIDADCGIGLGPVKDQDNQPGSLLDSDDNDPEQPGAGCPTGRVWLPGMPRFVDDDGDGFANVQATESEYVATNGCTLDATGQQRDSGNPVGPDTDDSDPNEPGITYSVCQTTTPLPSTVAPDSVKVLDQDGDGVPALYAQQQDNHLDTDCRLISTPGGMASLGFPDADDSDPEVPGIPSLGCGSSAWLPTSVQPQDADADGVPVLVVTEQEIDFTNCTPNITGNSRTYTVGVDPDDADPENPGRVPVLSCPAKTLQLPIGVSFVDEDMDGLPVLRVHMTSVTLSTSCGVTTVPGDVLVAVGDLDDNDPQNVEPPLTGYPCDAIAGTYTLPSGYEARDRDGDGQVQYVSTMANYTVAPSCSISSESAGEGDLPRYGDNDDHVQPPADPEPNEPGTSGGGSVSKHTTGVHYVMGYAPAAVLLAAAGAAFLAARGAVAVARGRWFLASVVLVAVGIIALVFGHQWAAYIAGGFA